MTEVTLDAGALDQIDATLSSLAGMAGEVTLRLDNHWPDETGGPALLAAALIGSLSEHRYLVDAVDAEAVEAVLQTAVASALSKRPAGHTRFTPTAARLDRPGLGALWTSGSRSAADALFSEPGERIAGAFGPTYGTFVNPHLSSASDGHADVVFLIRRWLALRLGGQSPWAETKRIVQAVGIALTELIANVQEHAAGAECPKPDCLVRLRLADGLVRCSVLDTGIGMDETLRRKLGSELTPEERIGRLIAGEIPGWDAGRGIGIPRIRREVARVGGDMSVFTGQLRATAHAAEAPDVRAAPFSVAGTVVHFTVPATLATE